MRNKHTAFAIFSAIFLASTQMTGCATKLNTVIDAQAAKGTGTIREYAKPFDDVWKATLVAIKNTTLEIVYSDIKEGKILASHGMTMGSYGEKVAIFVEPVASNGRVSVEVVSKKVMPSNIGGTNWEPVIFEELSKRMLPARD